MDSQQKICPMKLIAQQCTVLGFWCGQESCAWWRQHSQSCALLALADIMANYGNRDPIPDYDNYNKEWSL